MTATDDRLRIAFSFESAIMMAKPAREVFFRVA
jgi:hypothetical protein